MANGNDVDPVEQGETVARTGEMRVDRDRSGMGEVIRVMDGNVLVWGWARHIDPEPGDAPSRVVRGLINEIDRLREGEKSPALTEEQIEVATKFSLAMIFTEFERDGFVSPGVHEERERLSGVYHEDNVMTSFFTGEDGAIRLGLFVRMPEDGSTPTA